MVVDMDIKIYLPNATHTPLKVCFKYECEPDEDDLFSDVCTHFNNGDVPWKQDAINSIMNEHFYSESGSESICERCRFLTRTSKPLDSQHIQHANRNPILNSKWFLKNLYCMTSGPVSNLFHSNNELLSEIIPTSISDAIVSLEETEVLRTSDKDAKAESLEVLRWILDWYKKEPNIAVLVTWD